MDTLKLNKHDSIWIQDTIENDLQRLYDHYRDVYNRNEYLRNEVERVKSEKYAEEEMSKMREKYEKMHDEYFRGFPVSEEEEKKIKEWMDGLPKANSGPIGGRFKYEFTPTSIGTIASVVDTVTKERITFRELS